MSVSGIYKFLKAYDTTRRN